jgi:sugar phosphate isomerase/epimerase
VSHSQCALARKKRELKFAFSTLACPQWSTEQIVTNALKFGYDAIELRLLDGEVIDPNKDADKVVQAVKLSRSNGLEVCALDTSSRVNQPDEKGRADTLADLRAWFRLAQEVQVPLLRIFGGPGKTDIQSQPTAQEVDQQVIDLLGQIAQEAEQAHVTVALETHDSFSSAKRVGTILKAVNSKFVGALWDSQHPYRVGETAEEVYDYLGHTNIVHVHVKDARRTGPGEKDWQLVLLGDGEVPVREQLQLLQQNGYNGYASVEWEKKWHPEIPEPEIALPQHIHWLKALPFLQS